MTMKQNDHPNFNTGDRELDALNNAPGTPGRWRCKQCGKRRRSDQCLNCGNAERITDDPRMSYYIR